MLWLYAETGTLLFYDDGNGCLEQAAVAKLAGQAVVLGLGLSTAIALLIFCGAIGKSGQVPLHVWLPDAMEGPTPVSALIHAATMVAAGVFLVARAFPLFAATFQGPGGDGPPLPVSTALQAVTWIGAITAVFAASIAVAQTDIKRILAYSTVSQLGFMFMGLGAGGVAVGMFHLLTHAFFKALLFLGAGSVIHGCHEEQDIRRMGGLRRFMPVTFAAYAVGMMALSGVPLFFSGFWSKDEILHAAWLWQPSKWPFVLGLVGAFLTAFYMTRQMWFVFFDSRRNPNAQVGIGSPGESDGSPDHADTGPPHESPPVMTVPLVVLAICTVLLGVFGTPLWPWFHSYLSGHGPTSDISLALPADTWLILVLSSVIALSGIGLSWRLYSRRSPPRTEGRDPLEELQPHAFGVLRRKFFIDELYEISIVRWNAWSARASRALDDKLWNGLVTTMAHIILGLAWLSRLLDEFVMNLGFDRGCGSLRLGARVLSLWQNGRVQRYLRITAAALAVFALIFIWGCR